MKDLDTTQVEQLKQIGEQLLQERQHKGIPLEEIALKTYIPLRLLQALEVGQTERLPEPVFIQGFIRRYGDAIGLDGSALAKTFEFDRSPLPSPPVAVTPSSVPVAPSAVDPTTSVPATHSSTAEQSAVSVATPPAIASSWQPIERPTKSAAPILPWAIGSLAFLVMGAVVIGFLNQPKAPTRSTPTTVAPQPSKPAPPVSASQSSQGSPSPAASPVARTTPKPAASATGPVQVSIDLQDESWMAVVVDGKPEFEGTLKKGDQKTWTAKKSIALQLGNAGAVRLSYNQGQAKLLGAPGEVKNLTFPPQGQN